MWNGVGRLRSVSKTNVCRWDGDVQYCNCKRYKKQEDMVRTKWAWRSLIIDPVAGTILLWQMTLSRRNWRGVCVPIVHEINLRWEISLANGEKAMRFFIYFNMKPAKMFLFNGILFHCNLRAEATSSLWGVVGKLASADHGFFPLVYRIAWVLCELWILGDQSVVTIFLFPPSSRHLTTELTSNFPSEWND